MQMHNHTIWGSFDINPRGKDLLAYCASAEADINEFQPFKASGPDGLYPVLLQKGSNQLKGYYHVIFQGMPETQQCAIGMERRHRYISPQTGKGKPV